MRRAFDATRELRASRRDARGIPAGEAARGLGKLLVVAPDQTAARHYLDVIRDWIPAAQAEAVAQLATSDTPHAHEILAAFRLRPEPSVLVKALRRLGIEVTGVVGSTPERAAQKARASASSRSRSTASAWASPV